MGRVIPMFPLGSVLFPHAVLPLHVFEPRYRALTEHCLANDGQFGVVLIERGSEVGGGDARFQVGTVAQIMQAGKLDDGRYVLVNVGVERMRVKEWLTEEPFPRADVELLRDRDGGGVVSRAEQVESALKRVLAMRAELGDPAASVDVVLDDDPVRASYEAAALAPLGPLDAQRLLELDDVTERMTALEALLVEEAAVLQFRLSDG